MTPTPRENGFYWTLNGTYLSPFRALGGLRIDRLKFVCEVFGVYVFSDDQLPQGTAELWDRGKRVAIIEGIGI